MPNNELHTPRLRLRPFREEDAEAIFQGYASDEEVTRYLRWNPHSSVEETRRVLALWLEEDRRFPRLSRFALTRKEEGDLIGAIDVVGWAEEGVPEIGYVLARPHWGKGYMSEALRAFAAELFSRGYPCLYACADYRNAASIRVLEKNGFREIGERPLSPISPWKEGSTMVKEFLLRPEDLPSGKENGEESSTNAL